MSEVPSYDLELKAAEDRRKLHASLTELSSKLHQDLNVNNQVRRHFTVACTAAALIALGVGYSFTGLFVRH
jgi:hypothetical protein